MPSRGRIPRFLILFVLVFAFVGTVGFQIMKERRIASAALSEKEFQLLRVENDLKEQLKVSREREEERDFAQTKLLEIERKSSTALDSLRAKELELQSIQMEHQRTVELVTQLKKVVEQKDGEIVSVREKLQDVSFDIAKESAKQITNGKVEPERENRQVEEHRAADEAGLDDRKRIQEEEEAAGRDTDVSATEREMDERSKPKDDISLAKVENHHDEAAAKINETLKLDALQDEEAEEQDNADTRDLDEKEIDASQEVDLNEVTKLEADLQTGDHEEADSQQIDHGVE